MLTDKELKVADFALENVEAERLLYLNQAATLYSGLEELRNRFANSSGIHEVQDRVFMQSEIWQEFINEHPTILMDEDAFRLATLVTQYMQELYQTLGKYYDQCPPNE